MDPEISPPRLRIIDANTNRIGEGLRVLEEVARLVLGDAPLTQQLKDLRHKLVRSEWPLQRQSLQARDSDGDVGADMAVHGEGRQRDLPALVVANSRRVQESLRVMEELAKTPGLPLSTDEFKHARFSLYTIEKTLVSRLLRQDKTGRLRGLHVILDPSRLKRQDHMETAGQVIGGGARVIHLRDNVHSTKALLPVAAGLKEVCARHDVLFIVHGHLDLALAVDADGLHLGQDDLPPGVARRLLPMGALLGISVSTVEQAVTAQDEGADYALAAPIHAAGEAIGVAGLRRIRQAVRLPVVACGGITRDNLDEVIAAGAEAVAMTLSDAPDFIQALRQIAEGFKDERNS